LFFFLLAFLCSKKCESNTILSIHLSPSPFTLPSAHSPRRASPLLAVPLSRRRFTRADPPPPRRPSRPDRRSGHHRRTGSPTNPRSRLPQQPPSTSPPQLFDRRLPPSRPRSPGTAQRPPAVACAGGSRRARQSSGQAPPPTPPGIRPPFLTPPTLGHLISGRLSLGLFLFKI
jgi:hypothetical protein